MPNLKRANPKANKITAQEKVKIIIKTLSKLYPNPKTPLYHNDVFQLLIAVLLSAQMRDDRLNKVLPTLFKKYPDAKSFNKASVLDLEKILKSVNFYKNKVKYIKGLSKILVKKYNGKVSKNLDELIKLPGIGKKSANVILNEGFGIASGIVVDTHVKRVAKRLGLTQNTDPKKVEEDLKAIVPKKYWREFSLWLIFFGRNICTARNPKCETCPLKGICMFHKEKN